MNKYQEAIRTLSEELVLLQKPIRILDAIKWPLEVEADLKNGRLPKINYRANELKYDPFKKMQDLQDFCLKVDRLLGPHDPVAKILKRNSIEYINVISMILTRGTREFYHYSKILYGSPSELLADKKTKLYEMSTMMESILAPIKMKEDSIKKKYSSDDVVRILSERLGPYFKSESIKVLLSDGIVSDASAGADYIKIKRNLMYSKKDIEVFEVHEGWTHLGTTINGELQSYAKWLSKGPPCSTITQEGLAVLMELFYFALSPERVRKLNDRLFVCKMVEDGADLFQIINFFKNERGMDHSDAIKNAARVFRGSDLNGSYPFTKDISYLKGFFEIYNFLRACVRENKIEQIPFLFAGKVTLEDVPVIYELYQNGLIEYPKYLPSLISDLSGLSMWMAFSNFLNLIHIDDQLKIAS